MVNLNCNKLYKGLAVRALKQLTSYSQAIRELLRIYPGSIQYLESTPYSGFTLD